MCPNCQAIWSMEEIDEEYCGAGGYPNCDEDEVDDTMLGLNGEETWLP